MRTKNGFGSGGEWCFRGSGLRIAEMGRRKGRPAGSGVQRGSSQRQRNAAAGDLVIVGATHFVRTKKVLIYLTISWSRSLRFSLAASLARSASRTYCRTPEDPPRGPQGNPAVPGKPCPPTARGGQRRRPTVSLRFPRTLPPASSLGHRKHRARA